MKAIHNMVVRIVTSHPPLVTTLAPFRASSKLNGLIIGSDFLFANIHIFLIYTT